MSYLDFVNSIGCEKFKENVEDSFDEIMMIIYLCELYRLNVLSVNMLDKDKMEFELSFANDAEISSMENILNSSNGCFQIYGNWFQLIYNRVSNTSLMVTVIPCPQ